jgi:MFS family permease
MPVTVPSSRRHEPLPVTTDESLPATADESLSVTINKSLPTTTTTRPTAPPRRQPLQLALILVAAFMVVLDFSIVNVALPSIERELGMPADAVQWIVTGYAISFGGLLILGGRAADLFGRRRMFVAGLVAFSLASLAGGLARDPALLIAARVVQGAGAAIVAPAALSLITTGFPEGPERTRAIGLYGAVSSVGFVSGQVLGGILVQFTSWRAVFLVNVPVGLIAAALSPHVLGTAKTAVKTGAAKAGAAKAGAAKAGAAKAGAAKAGARRLDVRGALLITIAVTLVVFAVSQGVALGWTSPLVIAAVVVAAVATAGFMKAEARHPEPLVRPSLLHRKGLRDGTTLAFLLGLYNGGEMLIMSLYLQQVLHESPLLTGLIIAPQGVVGFTAGLLGPRLARRIGVKRMLVLTGAAAAVGFAVLTRLPAVGYSPVLLVVMLIGFGTAGTAFGMVVLASRGMADADQGLVGGVINTSRQIGAAVGAALLPAVAEGVSGGIGVSGDRAAMFAAALAALTATVVAWRAARAVPARAAS